VVAGNEWLLLTSVILLLLVHDALLIGLLVAAAEFATPASNSLVAGSRVAATPDPLQGRVAAVSAMIAMSLAWLGPVGVGFTFQRAGSTTTILIVGAWALALAVVATLAPALRLGPPSQPTASAQGPEAPSRTDVAGSPRRKTAQSFR
jgi:hypothetical protein